MTKITEENEENEENVQGKEICNTPKADVYKIFTSKKIENLWLCFGANLQK